VRAERRTGLLADQGEPRLMVELGVVETIQQVDGARPLGGEAHAHLAGKLGMARGHEPGHLLVAHLYKVDGARLRASAPIRPPMPSPG